MTAQTPSTTFETVTQRVVYSYQRQMPDFAPLLRESLSPSERDKMRVSQQDLDTFFRALYQCAYDEPATFGLPTSADAYVDDGYSKEEKRAVAGQIKKARNKLAAGVDYLRHIGQKGTLDGDQLRLSVDDYASFFAKGPRVKRKLVQGMQAAGLSVSERENTVLIGNTTYPQMMPALQALAQACAQREDQRLAALLFARCDFRALDAGFEPDLLDMLQTAFASTEYSRAVELHKTLAGMGYEPSLEIAGAHNWRVRYQGKRAIKSTAFFEYEYDERGKRPLRTTVKCAATNRLVPLLSQQPAGLQQDFFQHAHSCGAPKCSWCKTRKSLNPSVLRYGGEQRTICWWMQRHFAKLDGAAVDLVVQYAQLHESLLAA
jgi:hypothetical protein